MKKPRKPKDLRLREHMTKEEIKRFGKDNKYRIEYAYGAVFNGESDKPILLKTTDFWMPLGRAKKIHDWLGRAIAACER